MKPIIALDIDGVLSPILKDSDFGDENYYRWDLANLTWPLDEETDETPWVKTNCMEAYVAKPVSDFFRSVALEERAEIMWHSTWGESAKRFEQELDLSSFEVLYQRFPAAEGEWQKAADVAGLLAQGRQVIWLDDHISSERVPEEVLNDLNLFPLAPGPGDIVGLSASDLRLVERQLRVWGF